MGLNRDVASVVQHVAATAAERLEGRARDRGGLSVLRERADLEPEFIRALQERFHELAEKDRKVQIPGWRAVGNVDVLVRTAPGSSGLLLAAELKWCSHDKLYEAIWDLFKMALLASRDDVDAAYLVTGAPSAFWATNKCSDLFGDGVRSPLELCSRRFETGGRRLMWDWLLEESFDRFPTWVPAAIATNVAAIVGMRVEHEAWDLRVVRVTPVGEEKLWFREGWPSRRPTDARRPLPPEIVA